MSSCLTGGGRTYGFDLDIVRSQSPSARSSHSSSPSSTLSESSNSPRGISTKRARTPRKRPNQTYTEAATLLSTVYPKVFSPKNLGKLCKHTRPYESFSESPELLPPFPVIGDAGFLIRNQSPEKPSFRFDPKPSNSIGKVNDFLQPGSPSPLEDFDAESILDEEVKEGIDSIMGNLSMNNSVESANCNPFFGSFGLRGRFELGFGFGNIRRALRHVDDGEWWRSPTVAVNDIVPKFKALPSPSSSEKKKKKKVEKEEVKQLPTSTPVVSQENLKSSLLLKLNCDEVIHEWSDRGFPFGNVLGTSESSAEAITRLVDIDLFPEASSGGMREASVMRYKEKRRNRLFSKKIRYQVRKVNADRRPRMKASGRFVKRPALLEEAIDEEMKEES